MLLTSGRFRREQYAGPVSERRKASEPAAEEVVRDPLAMPGAVRDAQRRSMAERLELALAWDKVASELRLGLAETTARARSDR